MALAITRTTTMVLLRLLILCLWLAVFTVSYDSDLDHDVHCLKSIKNSIQDPHNRLLQWDFDGITYKGDICSFWGVDCWSSVGKVMRIDLSNMGLTGKFPADIDSCKSLTSLSLSNNHLTGPIPDDISKKLPFVTILDLSNNSFSGEIPSDLANCSYLNYLYLNDNHFVGQIPPELSLLPRLAIFSVISGNHLSGEVPNFGTSVVVSYTNNQGLCGASTLGSCHNNNGENFITKFTDGFLVGYAVFLAVVVNANIFIHYRKLKRIKKIIKERQRRQSTTR
ncbi:hypothetical protein ACFE04_026335 [Oxalis oulophora]